MENNTKKYRRNAVAVIVYIFAAIMLLYTCYLAGSTIAQINEYYAQYGMTAKPSEYFTYVGQSALTPLFNTVVLFMLAYILDAVRKTDPKNWMTDAEFEEAKIAKKEAKDAKKFAKGEKAAAKAGHTTGDESTVAADFANDLEKELKADEPKKDENKKSGENGQNNRNNNGNNGNGTYRRQQGNRQNGYRNNRRNNYKYNNRNNDKNNDQNKFKAEEKKAEDNTEPVVANFADTSSESEE